MTFVQRISQSKLEEFFNMHHIKGEVQWKPEDFCAIIKRPNCQSYSTVRFTQTLIKAPGDMELMNGDWQVFLRHTFGKEYMKVIKKKDFPNDFIPALSHEEILELIPFYHVYDFEECEALQVGTRRFKIRPGCDAPLEEVILGPFHTDGTVRFYGVKEDAFYRFMTTRFGRAYYQYFRKRAREEAQEDIMAYFAERLEEVVKKEEKISGFLSQ